MIDFSCQTDFVITNEKKLNVFYCNLNYNNEVSTYCNLTFNPCDEANDDDFSANAESTRGKLKLKNDKLLERKTKVAEKETTTKFTVMDNSDDQWIEIKIEPDDFNSNSYENPAYINNLLYPQPICFEKSTQTRKLINQRKSKIINDKSKIDSEYVKSKKEYTCKMCGKVLNSYAKVVKHIEELHKPKPSFLSCNQCTETFTLALQLQHHVELIHGEKTDIKCSFCESNFTETKMYLKHLKKYHTELSANCPICNKTFRNSKEMHSHKRHHNKKHKCDVCSKCFVKPNRLRRHMASNHSAEKPFQCDLCDSKFSIKPYLLEHKKNQHLKTIDNENLNHTFKCTVCYKEFAYKRRLSEHMKCHSCSRQYSCTSCGRNFYTQSQLERHSLAHLERSCKLTCPYCNKICKTNYKLVIHIRTHTGEKPFKCPTCNAAFKSTSARAAHERSVHGVYVEMINEDGSTYRHLVKFKRDRKQSSPQKRLKKIKSDEVIIYDEYSDDNFEQFLDI